MPEGFSSSTRRRAFAGVLLVVAAVTLVAIAQQRDERSQPARGGNVSACARLTADLARACYTREVGRELSAVSVTDVRLEAPADSKQVTFTAATSEPEPLLCELHERVGVVDEQTPSWVGWSEPLVAAAPQS